MTKGYSSEGDGAGRPLTDTVSENGRSAGPSSGKGARSILLIDDRSEVASAMEIAFRMAGHRLTVATGPEEAFSHLARARFDAIMLDLNFTPGKTDGREGLACLARIVAEDPAACVVVLTAHGGIRIAVAAMQAGARDFAVKPWKNSDLIAKVEAAIARAPMAAGRAVPAGEMGGDARAGTGDAAPPRLLGESARMVALRDLIRRIAPSAAGVAVTGPSGAGRMLTALAIHVASADAPAPPLRVDLREDDALARLEGASGTVILRHPDRLDDVAQDRLAERLTPAIRPIAIADGTAGITPALRRRIATVELAVPPLADRPEDIPLLARHFLHDAAARFGRPVPRLTEAAQAALLAADWPDQLRGLAATMERAVLLAEDGTIDSAALSQGPLGTPDPAAQPGDAARSFDLDRSERAMIVAALAEHHHNVSHAARALGLSRGALYRRMERYGL